MDIRKHRCLLPHRQSDKNNVFITKLRIAMMLWKKLPLSFIIFGIMSAYAEAPSVSLGSLTLTNYWVRPSTGRPNTAAYTTITNHGTQHDKLVKAVCIHANTVEIHEHIEENGVMKMRPVVGFVEVGKEPVVMKPGGLHIMLMGLKDSFKNQEVIPITLHFEKAGAIDLKFPVVKSGAQTQPCH
jgi:periplasmic copper chaperone A